MNIGQKNRTPLQTCQFFLNIPIFNQSKQPQSNPKSNCKRSPSFLHKRQSFYSKQKNQIPTPRQAKLRQKQIKYFHNRNFYHKKRNLQEIYKQNMRIYSQLNKQKSYYHVNFRKDKIQRKSKKQHSVSCSDYQTAKQNDMQKYSKDQFMQNYKFKLQRRFSFSVGKSVKKDVQRQMIEDKVKMGKAESDFYINLKRYQKNKTEVIPRNKKNGDSIDQYNSFIQKGNKTKKQQKLRISIDDKMFTQTKNPAYLRMKRRPNSGFRG